MGLQQALATAANGSASQRQADARQMVQGRDGLASKGLLGRMQGAGAIKSGYRNNNAGSQQFAEMKKMADQGIW
jgi:hypothetical protein